MINSTTEMTLAIRAPPLRETMLAVTPGVSPVCAIWATPVQTITAAISYSMAARLVARSTAPIWLRSPNLSTVAMAFTTGLQRVARHRGALDCPGRR